MDRQPGLQSGLSAAWSVTRNQVCPDKCGMRPALLPSSDSTIIWHTIPTYDPEIHDQFDAEVQLRHDYKNKGPRVDEAVKG